MSSSKFESIVKWYIELQWKLIKATLKIIIEETICRQNHVDLGFEKFKLQNQGKFQSILSSSNIFLQLQKTCIHT